MSRPRGDHARRRAEIADAAAGVIAARGLERVTLKDIGARLGVTTGVLTHYFPNKGALLRLTKERAFDRALARAQAASGAARGIERLHASVAALLPVDPERVVQWRLLVAFHGDAVGRASLRRAQDRRMHQWWGLFRDLVAGLQADGTISRRLDAMSVGMAIAIFVEGHGIQFAMSAEVHDAAWQVAFARDVVDRLAGRTARTARTAR